MNKVLTTKSKQVKVYKQTYIFTFKIRLHIKQKVINGKFLLVLVFPMVFGLSLYLKIQVITHTFLTGENKCSIKNIILIMAIHGSC